MVGLASGTAFSVRVVVVVEVVLPAVEGRKARHLCPAAAWNSRRSRSASFYVVHWATLGNVDPSWGALAAMPMPTVAEMSLSDHSSSILESSSLR